MNGREIIAKNIAALLQDGDFVNLGVGMPIQYSPLIHTRIRMYERNK